MAYEKAIRLLAHLECPQPPGMSDVKYLSLVDDVCRSKFTYVVASQVGFVWSGEGGRGGLAAVESCLMWWPARWVSCVWLGGASVCVALGG